MRRRPTLLQRLSAAAMLGAALGALAPRAEAQPRDPAAAEALFRAGLEALDRGEWTAACAKFSASQALDPSAGTSINLARCAERDGKLASAWAELQRARVLAREAPESRRRELEGFVDAETRRLEPRLPRLRVVGGGLPAGAEVRRDGVLLAPGALGEALPVDVGTHRVEASAPGHLPGSWEIEAKEGAVGEVVVTLARDPAALAAPPPPPSAPSAGTAEPAPREPRSRALPILGVVLAGVGVAGLAVGTVAGAHAIDAKGDIEELGCSHATGTCATEEAAEQAATIGERGSSLAAVSTISFIAGGLLVGTGAALLVVDALSDGPAERAAERKSARLTPAIGPDGAALVLGGGF